MFVYSSELSEPYFTESLEVFDSINMVVSIVKLALAVLDAIMLHIPVVDEPVVSLEALGVNDSIGVCFAFNNWQ